MKRKILTITLATLLLSLSSCSPSFSQTTSNEEPSNTVGETGTTNETTTIEETTTKEDITTPSTAEEETTTSPDVTTNTPDNPTTPPDSKYDTLKSCSEIADGTSVKVLAVITGSDGSGLYLQDDTASFYAYGIQNISFNIGDKVEIEGTISSYAGNKQINKGFTLNKIGTGKSNIISVNSLSEISNNKYAQVSFKATLKAKPSYTAGKDCSIKITIGGTDTTLFIKKSIAQAQEIINVINKIEVGGTIEVNGGFSNAYNGSTQISITSPDQIIGKAPVSIAEILAYAEEMIKNITSLNNTKISSDLELITSGNYGVTFVWSSTNTTHLSTTGVVTRPETGESDVTLTLTVEININGVKEKTINTVLIISAKPEQGSVELPDEAKKYYQDIDFTASAQSLKTSLSKLISKHTVVGYGSLESQIYPDSDTDSNGYVYDIYSSHKSKLSDFGGSYKKEGDCLNKEHTTPQSWFSKASPYRSDAFHVFPSDGKVNGVRSNYLFGEVKAGTASYTSTNGSQLGSSGFSGFSGTVFEVTDEYKGDIARAFFYMSTAYENACGSWSGSSGTHYTTSSFTKLTSYSLNLFTKWAEEDPVSQRERDRNNGIYKHQRNRNPYIDIPYLASQIYKAN